jgi:RecA/RadA recombinase
MEDLQSSLLKAVKHGQPFIYILDCLDALTTKEEEEKAYKKALRKATTETEAKEIKDAHKAKKAGEATQLFRLIDSELKETESTLIIISQVRDLIGAMPFQSKKTRSGGRALKFYSTHEMWMVITGREKRQGKGKKKQEVGITANVKVSKNKLTGKVREIPIRIWNDYGIDDLSVNIDFLLAEEYWDKENRGNRGQFIFADDLDLEPATKGDLIRKIEEQELEDEVRKLVGECWNEIEESLKVSRKPRYT